MLDFFCGRHNFGESFSIGQRSLIGSSAKSITSIFRKFPWKF